MATRPGSTHPELGRAVADLGSLWKVPPGRTLAIMWGSFAALVLDHYARWCTDSGRTAAIA